VSVIFILILIGLILASGFFIAFVWALKTGQFDDLDTPAMRSLFDE
jgi:cbb3-type cytochrome oxidase maturation protein